MTIKYKDECGIACMVRDTPETAPNWELFCKDDCDKEYHFSHEIPPEQVMLIVAKQICGNAQ